MRYRCRFGIHDWETVNVMRDCDIVKKAKREMNIVDPIGNITTDHSSPRYYDRICLCCGKRKESLSRRLQEHKIFIQNDVPSERKRLAKEMWDRSPISYPGQPQRGNPDRSTPPPAADG